MMSHQPETQQHRNTLQQELDCMLELLDDLHSAVSENDPTVFAAMSETEMMNTLREMIYTAQETIAEIQAQRKARPILRLVEKDVVEKIS